MCCSPALDKTRPAGREMQLPRARQITRDATGWKSWEFSSQGRSRLAGGVVLLLARDAGRWQRVAQQLCPENFLYLFFEERRRNFWVNIRRFLGWEWRPGGLIK